MVKTCAGSAGTPSPPKLIYLSWEVMASGRYHMKLGMPISYGEDFEHTVDNLLEFEEAALDRVMIPEAYGFDAVSQMGYVAARTRTVELSFGILPMFTRTPTTLAMT